MNIQNLVLDINKKPFQTITANVGEVASRFIRITLLDNNIPFDLTGINISLYAEKPDSKKVFNNVTIEDKVNGVILAELTSQVLTVEGLVKLTLLLIKNNAKLCSKQFLLNVDKSIVDDEAIESTNEFGLLTESLSKVEEWNGYFEETSGKIEEKYTKRLNIIETGKPYCNVSEFGAVGDGVTDDKTAIQNAVNYCASNNKELVFDSNKTYLCYSISIPAGIKINGNGATLKKPNLSAEPYNMDASQMKWIRMFTISHNNINDSANTIIENLNFNGNCWEMWSVEDGYSQEQASIIIASANNANPGRLNLTINNCTFTDNVSDGIHIVQNVKAQITNCRSKDCFRGGLTITGGNSTINVDNFIFESVNTNDGIDIEIDSVGYGGIYSSQINLNNIIMDDDLDVVASKDSLITLNNVIMKGEFIYLGCQGELFVSNSTLRPSNAYSSRLLLSGKGKMKFSNVKFEGANPLNGPCLPIQFYYEEEGSMITFDNCSFYGGTAGIQGGYSQTAKIFFNNCYFDDSITGVAIGEKDGSVEFAPLELHVSNCTFNNPGYSIKCLSSFEPKSTVYISNINVTNTENTGFFYHQPTVIYDVVLINGYGTKYSTGANPTVYGKRLLFVDDDPNTLNLIGYKNIDIAILKTDKTQRWEFSHNNASSSWKNVWTLI